MKVAVIAVGKEVLTGKTTNTNLKTIASKLLEIGIEVNRSFVIDDIKEEYHKILDFITEDLIIFTGGLGPTIDDITRETVLEYFETETYLDENVLEYIKSIFDKAGFKMKDTNNKQALMPKNGTMLHNLRGTAPGLYFKTNGKIIVLLPGPPIENTPMLDEVVELLRKELDIKMISKGYRLVGTGESYMEDKLKGFYNLHPNVNVAPYAGTGEIKYIFTSNNEADLITCMNDFYRQFNEFIYGDLSDSLEGVIVKKLLENEASISFAESCTGGLIASTIVNVSGSSRVFNESFVTYSNEAKMKHLNVSNETLNQYGAVSKECAFEMALGLHKNTGSTVSVSVTGIAGPTGGTEEKPVGLVYFGIHYNGETSTFRRVFPGNREQVRQRARTHALNLVRKKLKNS